MGECGFSGVTDRVYVEAGAGEDCLAVESDSSKVG